MTRLAPGDRVLLRMPNWLGDFVLAEPFVNALHERLEREGGALSLAGPARALALFEGRFDAAQRLPILSGESEDPRTWRGHDAAIFLNASFRSVLGAMRACIPNRVGWLRGGRGLLLTGGGTPARERGRAALGRGRKGRRPRSLPRPFESAVMELAGWAGVAVARRTPRLSPTVVGLRERDERAATLGLDPAQPYLLLNAAGRPGSAKAWQPAHWLELIQRLASRDLPLVVLGAPGEDEVVRELASHPSAGVYALLDPTPALPELLAWTAGAMAFVTVDSGPRHLATATDTPAVVLYGSTDPRHTADFLTRQRAIVADVACAPCHAERCTMTADRHLQCLSGLTPERVEAALEELLRDRAR